MDSLCYVFSGTRTKYFLSSSCIESINLFIFLVFVIGLIMSIAILSLGCNEVSDIIGSSFCLIRLSFTF